MSKRCSRLTISTVWFLRLSRVVRPLVWPLVRPLVPRKGTGSMGKNLLENKADFIQPRSFNYLILYFHLCFGQFERFLYGWCHYSTLKYRNTCCLQNFIFFPRGDELGLNNVFSCWTQQAESQPVRLSSQQKVSHQVGQHAAVRLVEPASERTSTGPARPGKVIPTERTGLSRRSAPPAQT